MSPPQEFCRYKIKVFRNLWNKFHIQRVSVWVWNFEQSKIAELIHWAVLRLFCYEADRCCCSHCLSVVVLTLTGRLQAAGTDRERSLTTDNWQLTTTSTLDQPLGNSQVNWHVEVRDTTCSWKLSVSPDQAGRCLLCSGGACCVFTTSYVTTDRPGITRPIWDHTHTALPPLSVLCVMVCILRWPPPIHHGQTNTEMILSSLDSQLIITWNVLTIVTKVHCY